MAYCKRYLLSICCLILIALIPAHAQKIVIKTEAGDIFLELNPAKAPITVSNFLSYVDKHLYDGVSFYRVVRMNNQPDKQIKIEVIQGGLDKDSTKRLDSIKQETTKLTGLKHLDGTVSMARSGPNSASSEFFICINDQPELDFGGRRNPDGQGFAAFGKVTKGKDVVRKIQMGETGSAEKGQLLLHPVKIISVSRITP